MVLEFVSPEAYQSYMAPSHRTPYKHLMVELKNDQKICIADAYIPYKEMHLTMLKSLERVLQV